MRAQGLGLPYNNISFSFLSVTFRISSFQRQRSATAGALIPSTRPLSSGAKKRSDDGLTPEELRILRQTREEYSRRGGFVRVFPSPDSWELYG